MEDDIEELSRKIKKHIDEMVKEIKGMDVEEETLDILKETEKGLGKLSDIIGRKRKEMEDRGVKRTLKKDAAKIVGEVEKVVSDIKETLEDDR